MEHYALRPYLTAEVLWCGAHVFEGFFGLEDEPVKSVKMKVETRTLEALTEFTLCAYNFGALRVSVVSLCEPHPQKNVKPNKRAVLKARGLLLS